MHSQNPIELPRDKTDLCEARYHAASAAEHLFAAYWAADRNNGTALFLLTEAHSQFAKMAEALGYTITRTAGPDTLRTRPMNAELPEATPEVLAAKGMI